MQCRGGGAVQCVRRTVCVQCRGWCSAVCEEYSVCAM